MASRLRVLFVSITGPHSFFAVAPIMEGTVNGVDGGPDSTNRGWMTRLSMPDLRCMMADRRWCQVMNDLNLNSLQRPHAAVTGLM